MLQYDPSKCKRLAEEMHDREIDASYESSLQTYHRIYDYLQFRICG